MNTSHQTAIAQKSMSAIKVFQRRGRIWQFYLSKSAWMSK